MSVITAVAVAATMFLPEYLQTFHDEHNAKIFLTQSSYKHDVRQETLSGYRRDLNNLELQEIRAKTDIERQLIKQQIEDLKRERDDYKQEN